MNERPVSVVCKSLAVILTITVILFLIDHIICLLDEGLRSAYAGAHSGRAAECGGGAGGWPLQCGRRSARPNSAYPAAVAAASTTATA